MLSVLTVFIFVCSSSIDIGLSSVSISPTTEVKFESRAMQASTNCFVVVVGGKYLWQMDTVMKIADNVTEDVGRRPLAVLYVTNEEKIRSYYDQPFHLPLVIKFIYHNHAFELVPVALAALHFANQ